MLTIAPTTQVAKIVFVSGKSPDGQTLNWLASVMRQDGGEWEGVYRLRAVVDDKAFDSEDKKSWYRIVPKTVGQDSIKGELVAAVLQTAQKLAAMLIGAEIHILDVNGNGEKALRMLAKMPWVSMRSEDDPGDGSTEAAVRAMVTGYRWGN